MGDFVSNDEGAGESLIAVEGAGARRVAGAGDRRVARGSAYVQPREPHRNVVRLVREGEQLAVPLVHVLEGATRVAVVHLCGKPRLIC